MGCLMFANVNEALTDLVVEVVGGKGIGAELAETLGVDSDSRCSRVKAKLRIPLSETL